jgi:peptidoglycan/LPS O-acetylase OafA/YrhL
MKSKVWNWCKKEWNLLLFVGTAIVMVLVGMAWNEGLIPNKDGFAAFWLLGAGLLVYSMGNELKKDGRWSWRHGYLEAWKKKRGQNK